LFFFFFERHWQRKEVKTKAWGAALSSPTFLNTHFLVFKAHKFAITLILCSVSFLVRAGLVHTTSS